MDSTGRPTMATAGRDHPAPFVVVLYNDETHSFDQVVQKLKTVLHMSPHDATCTSMIIDAEVRESELGLTF